MKTLCHLFAYARFRIACWRAYRADKRRDQRARAVYDAAKKAHEAAGLEGVDVEAFKTYSRASTGSLLQYSADTKRAHERYKRAINA